jgi:hypothetical protein
MYIIGLKYDKNGEEEKAIEYFELAANEGHPVALHNIGTLFPLILSPFSPSPLMY